jgi:phage-related protein
MPHVKALGQGLFEIRIKAAEGIGRAFFCNIKGKIIIILHEFIKKTQKTPQKDMDLAKKRMREVKDNE